MVEDLLGHALLDHHTVLHEDHAVGDLAGKVHLMRDHDHGHAGVLGKVTDDVEDATNQLRIQGARRLIEKQHVGMHSHGARDGHALLLATGELGRLEVRAVRQAHGRELLHGLGLGLLLGALEDLGLANHHVLLGGEVREQVERLEHHANLAAQFVDVGLALPRDLLVLNQDVTGRGRLQQVDAAQHRRLARAGRSQHHDDLARPHVQVDVAQDLRFVEGLVEVLDAHDGMLALGEVVLGEGLVRGKGQAGRLLGREGIGDDGHVLARMTVLIRHLRHLQGRQWDARQTARRGPQRRQWQAWWPRRGRPRQRR